MAERDLGSTFLLPHTHLYKPDRVRDCLKPHQSASNPQNMHSVSFSAGKRYFWIRFVVKPVRAER